MSSIYVGVAFFEFIFCICGHVGQIYESTETYLNILFNNLKFQFNRLAKESKSNNV